MRKIDISYNNQSGASFGVFLYDYPAFSGGAKNYTTTSVPGRRGQLVSRDRYQENVQIDCTFSILSKNIPASVRVIRKWLSGTGTLVINEEPDIFYKVRKIVPGDFEREIRRYGRFSTAFICDPYAYTFDGQDEMKTVTYNPYDLCHPTYKIAGNGRATITVNEKSVTVIVGGEITIDTDLMLAYKNDTPMNTSITGDYEDLYLPKGDIDMSISSGFSMSVIPNWGYEL